MSNVVKTVEILQSVCCILFHVEFMQVALFKLTRSKIKGIIFLVRKEIFLLFD